MSANEYAAALPLPLILTGIALALVAAGLRVAGVSDAWCETIIAVAAGSLVLALGIAWCAA